MENHSISHQNSQNPVTTITNYRSVVEITEITIVESYLILSENSQTLVTTVTNNISVAKTIETTSKVENTSFEEKSSKTQ
jgi:hypothetical protein